jgi:hypothetical protein
MVAELLLLRQLLGTSSSSTSGSISGLGQDVQQLTQTSRPLHRCAIVALPFISVVAEKVSNYMHFEMFTTLQDQTIIAKPICEHNDAETLKWSTCSA